MRGVAVRLRRRGGGAVVEVPGVAEEMREKTERWTVSGCGGGGGAGGSGGGGGAGVGCGRGVPFAGCLFRY